jgi:hypothetical protein
MFGFVVAKRRITQAVYRRKFKRNECRLKVTPAEKSYLSSSFTIIAVLATWNDKKLNIVVLFIVMRYRAVTRASN